MSIYAKKFIITTLGFLFVVAGSAQENKVTVFVSGEEGHESYRIPAMISLPDGGILAFCEGRVNDSDDFGDIDIVMKRSNDNGKTWNQLQVVVDNDTLQAGNPAPVVDLSDPEYPMGRVFLFYNTGSDHEAEVRKGKAVREVWFKTSVDGGRTWSEPVNITTQVHRPKHPNTNPAYHFSEDWRSYANTPGHATQITSGKYAGRIFVAANHSEGPPQKQFRDYHSHGFYTDDHGKTFRLAETVSEPGSNEATATELSSDKLMINMRNQRGDVRQRIVGISSDGGETWDSVYFDKNLPDPVCEGSILTIGSRNGKNILAFCNAADTAQRNNLTLRVSFDEGRSWPESFVIDHQPGQKDNSAYSDIIRLDQGRIGILYEKEGYSKIMFTEVQWR